jgi:polar amino acid transport system substrate-binding protein
MTRTVFKVGCIGLLISALFVLSACKDTKKEKITNLQQLDGKEFAVPTGTVADKLVLAKFPNAKFKYFNSVLDTALAVKTGKADVAAYDEPILKNIAAKNSGLTVLPEMITIDNYGFAVQLEKQELKKNIDLVVRELRKNGVYDAMLLRWLPKSGNPAAMPDIKSSGSEGVLKLGTAAVTEPFSFMDGSQKIVGFDIELAGYIAQKLNMKLEVVNMDFGAMIPALLSGKVDMIAACITITDERAKNVLFSEPYYTGGIAALVKE